MHNGYLASSEWQIITNQVEDFAELSRNLATGHMRKQWLSIFLNWKIMGFTKLQVYFSMQNGIITIDCAYRSHNIDSSL